MLKSKFFWLLIILAAIGYFVVPRFMGGGNPMMGMPGGPMPVMVAKAVGKEITLWDEFSGRLKAVDDVEIRARVAGMVESVHFADGQLVKKGDLLFVIDPRPYEAALQAAQAQYKLAEAEFKRAESLLADKAISQREHDQRKNAADVAGAELKRAKLNVEFARVKAPVSGKVGRAEVTPGNLVDVGQPVMTTIVSQDPIYADFEADEQRFLQYIAAVEGGAANVSKIPVILKSASGITHEGKVQSFDNQIDIASGTIRVRAVFDNKDGMLVPGMFARLSLGGAGQKPAVLISDQAVSTDQDKKFVYVLGEGNTANYREVKLGPLSGKLRVVLEGLKAGETVVVSGLHRIQQPGMPVQPTEIPMEDADKPVPPPQAAAPENKEAPQETAK